MATTTPNYGWPVPTSTDLVKDGATAIEALGDAIDATVFGLPGSGLTLISDTSFSAVASHSVNDVFSATYNNYKIIFKGAQTGVGGIQLRMRLRVSGSDNTSSNYVFSTGVTNSASTFANNNSSTGTTSFYTTDIAEKNTNLEMTIYSPFATTETAYQTSGQGQNTANATQVQFGGGAMTVTTSYTGFTLFPNFNTMTGNVKVYGYKD
jgi:hypothetical protein